MKWILRSVLTLVILFVFSVTCFANNTKVSSDNADKSSAQDDTQSTSVIDTQSETPVSSIYSAPARANWFISGGVGKQRPFFNNSTMTIFNGSGFPAPYNQDIYSTRQNYQPLVTLSAGRRWQRDAYWFPAYAIGMLYQHTFQTNAGGTIMQYSSPAFINYAYNLDISSNIFLAILKLNIFQFDGTSPYLCGGLGAAFNRTSGYKEAPMPGLTVSRVSAGFASESTDQFAYNIGAGVDYQVTQDVILSAEYRYQHFGNVRTGQGSGTWAGQSLNLGTYRANTFMFNVSYLFGN